MTLPSLLRGIDIDVYPVTTKKNINHRFSEYHITAKKNINRLLTQFSSNIRGMIHHLMHSKQNEKEDYERINKEDLDRLLAKYKSYAKERDERAHLVQSSRVEVRHFKPRPQKHFTHLLAESWIEASEALQSDLMDVNRHLLSLPVDEEANPLLMRYTDTLPYSIY